MPHDQTVIESQLDPDPIAQLYQRPGFLIRRAHQIAVSVFLAETAEMRVTTTQYGIMLLLSRRTGLDQASVARMLGLDRSTTALVVRKLDADGLVFRTPDSTDRRRQSLALTPAGTAMLERLHGPAQRALAQLLAPLEPAERGALLKLLTKLNDAHNTAARVPLMADDDPAGETKTDAD